MDKQIPRILIVDDATLLATMSDILKLKGFETFAAQMGSEALAQFEKSRDFSYKQVLRTDLGSRSTLCLAFD